MFCTKCGFQIKDGYKFCPKCGTPAYIEKEDPKSEIKKEVDEVTKESKADLIKEVTSTTEKNTKKVSKIKKEKSSPIPPKDSPLYPLIVKELDVKGVMKMAEQGDKRAMIRQAYRFEMGIGVEVNKEISDSLYSQVGGKNIIPELEDVNCPTIIPVDH